MRIPAQTAPRSPQGVSQGADFLPEATIMKTSNVFRAALSILLVLAIGGGNAFAAASKTMSGGACQAMFGMDQYFIDYNEQGMLNWYELPVWAVCDLVRDDAGNTTNEVSVFVRLTDRSPVHGFTCYVISCSNLGQSCSYKGFTTGTGFTGSQSIRIPIATSHYNGYYGVACGVPPVSHIHSLYVYEP
jgi:hypothetical protein